MGHAALDTAMHLNLTRKRGPRLVLRRVDVLPVVQSWHLGGKRCAAARDGSKVIMARAGRRLAKYWKQNVLKYVGQEITST
jgi:hypothetical protein